VTGGWIRSVGEGARGGAGRRRWSGYLPWRLRAFLRYAADRYVLAQTGRGEFAFIHLLVRDHLADCDPDALAAKVDQRIETRATRRQLAGRS
jgi:hypothetical protein